MKKKVDLIAKCQLLVSFSFTSVVNDITLKNMIHQIYCLAKCHDLFTTKTKVSIGIAAPARVPGLVKNRLHEHGRTKWQALEIGDFSWV
jgi:hypothetical protein